MITKVHCVTFVFGAFWNMLFSPMKYWTGSLERSCWKTQAPSGIPRTGFVMRPGKFVGDFDMLYKTDRFYLVN